MDMDMDVDTETDDDRARAVGINHVALEVGDVETAVEFYRDLLAVDLRGRTESGAFLDMGDQFLALMEVDGAGAETGGADDPDDHRHLGLVVDDPEALERRLAAMDVPRLDTSGLDFRDPWGNRIQVVGYRDVQFSKADGVLEGMGLAGLEKTAAAREELAAKGMAPDDG